MRLNELGDFLAGAFGPLALFWLVLGFFLQSRELQNSVDALNVQTEELQATVQAQRSMAKSAASDIQKQELRQSQNNWLEARKLELEVVNANSKVIQLTPKLKKSRHAVLSATGMLISGKRAKFDTRIAEILLEVEEIEHALSGVCPLPSVAEGGPSVESIALLFDLRWASTELLSEVSEGLRTDDERRQEIRNRNETPS